MNITKIQWVGLVFGIITSILIWMKMVYILSPHRDENGDVNITRNELIALGIGLIVALLKWLKLVAIIS
tara:strand:+ start:521 stop:727 length:207 start_codon:yes stop_codon:yes gene_type:complete